MQQPYIGIFNAKPIIFSNLKAKQAKYGAIVCNTKYLRQRG